MSVVTATKRVPEGLKASVQKPRASLSSLMRVSSGTAAGPSGWEPVRESQMQMLAPSSVEVTYAVRGVGCRVHDLELWFEVWSPRCR